MYSFFEYRANKVKPVVYKCVSYIYIYIYIYIHVLSRAETNTQFVHIFAQLHKYSNTWRVFRYTVNDISALILAYFVINYQLKGISVIK